MLKYSFIKISDFGLTVQLNNKAAPSLGTRKIAVKWTAPEAVKSHEVRDML